MSLSIQPQTIHHNANKTAYSTPDNTVVYDESVSALARLTLVYLLSKPPKWKLRANDIKRYLGVGINKVYRILRELREAGYLVMERIQSAVRWDVYEVPKPPAKNATTRSVIDRDGFHHDGHSDDLVITETPVKIEKPTTTASPVIDTPPASAKIDVVVSFEMSEQSTPDPIPHIAPDQQKAARKVLSELTPEQASLVLSAFTLALSKHKVSSKIGYLVGLVKAMNNGTFTAPEAAQGTPSLSLDERLAKERQRQQEASERGKMTVEEHAAWLVKQFGSKAEEGKKTSGRIGLRAALGWG
jgi:hypothetical protein